MNPVKMWAVVTRDTIASFRIYTFKSAAEEVAKEYNAIVKRDGFNWRYRVVPVIVTWDAKKKK